MYLAKRKSIFKLVTVSSLILFSNFCYAKISVEEIIRNLTVTSGLIKSAKFDEKVGVSEWKAVTYKAPHMLRTDYSDGLIDIKTGDIRYTFSPSFKILSISDWSASVDFLFEDVVSILLGSNLRLVGTENYFNTNAYILEGDIQPENKYYHSGKHRIKVWVDSVKWIILKAELAEKEGRCIQIYEVKKLIFYNDKIYFPSQVEERTEFHVKNLDFGKNIIKKTREFKSIQLNIEINDESFNIKLPKKTTVKINSTQNQLN
ncbi:MAG: hypothetical protein CVU78_01690 [Elusimicrobia bacterium HGW-Elusimicrobia-2]|nr:MAG: hypothetical protein CVU78_01690 [Elusimicrobia bacterium HGW-Elusimicrobia-2]